MIRGQGAEGLFKDLSEPLIELGKTEEAEFRLYTESLKADGRPGK